MAMSKTQKKAGDGAKAAKPRRGRPRKAIDARRVESLIAAGKTVEGAAAELGCSHDTLQRHFAGDLQKGRATRNSRLQVVQFNLAMGGNVAMAIWLGKQWLGQTDKQDIRTEGTAEVRVAGMTRAAWITQRITRLKEMQTQATPNDGDEAV